MTNIIQYDLFKEKPYERERHFNVTHGKKYERIYYIWTGIKQRCMNPKCKDFHRYGGRGIYICEEWKSFENFYADMGDPLSFQQIDRINNDGPYSKENCHWVNSKQNNQNRRDNRKIFYNGKNWILYDLWKEKSKNLGIHYSTLCHRMDNDWDIEKALSCTQMADKRKKQKLERKNKISLPILPTHIWGGQPGENCPNSKLTNEKVLEIRDRFDGTNAIQLSKEYSTSRTNIFAIVYRKNWKHI